MSDHVAMSLLLLLLLQAYLAVEWFGNSRCFVIPFLPGIGGDIYM